MRKEDDRHVGVRQDFYLSDYEYKMMKSAMSEFGCTNKSQFIRDAIFRMIRMGKPSKERKHG